MTTVRPMQPADAAKVAELATQLGYPSTAEEVEERMAELARNTRAVALVATSGDEVVGWIQVERTPSLAVGDTALIGGLVVDEAHRSERIGKALLEAGES